MKKVWKAVIITAVSLVCAFVLCVAACKIQYSVYKANNLETAKSVLLEYGIIDDNFLAAEDITKELFVVGFMRVLGMDDNAAESFDSLFLETTFGTREHDDAKEMEFYRFDYFRAWLICYGDYLRGYQTCYGDWLCENDGGIYPQLKVGSSDAVKYIYGPLSESYDFFEAVNKIKYYSAFIGKRHLQSDDLLIMLYDKMNGKRDIYIEREIIYDEKYNHYRYKEALKNANWKIQSDTMRSCTYLEMHKDRREFERIYEEIYGGQE